MARMTRRAVVSIAALMWASLILCGTEASASSILLAGSEYSYSGVRDDGTEEQDNVVVIRSVPGIDPDPGDFVFIDSAPILLAGGLLERCPRQSAMQVTCDAEGISGIVARGGAGND